MFGRQRCAEPINATWTPPTRVDGTLAIYAGKPFAGKTDPTKTSTAAGTLGIPSGNLTSFSGTTASQPARTYTVYFFAGSGEPESNGIATYLKYVQPFSMRHAQDCKSSPALGMFFVFGRLCHHRSERKMEEYAPAPLDLTEHSFALTVPLRHDCARAVSGRCWSYIALPSSHSSAVR